MPSIDILLACYNGERFLAMQLESLFAQSDQDWRLLVRDDGSDDRTMSVVAEYAAAKPGRIVVLHCQSERKGALANFSALLAASTAPYVMCCDQDDWWSPTKVALMRARMVALERQYGPGTPLLVHSDLAVVDDSMRVIDKSFWHFQQIDPRHDRLNHLLIQNVVTGCAMMVNRSCIEASLPFPREALMHDWWLALTAAAFGALAWIPAATVHYRQHDANSLGAQKFDALRMFQKIAPSRIRPWLQRADIAPNLAQARALLIRLNRPTSQNQLSLVQDFVSLDNLPKLRRLMLVTRRGFWRSGLMRNLIWFVKA